MNEFPSIDLMIGQLNDSITKIEATTLSKENYVLQTLRVALRLALDIKKEELKYFKSKTPDCLDHYDLDENELEQDRQTENQIEQEQINKHLN
jgi:hypothetical protein